MEKVLLGITIGSVPSRFIPVVRSLLDFIYLSQLQSHTSTTLNALESCLKTFHNNKNIIIELEIREHFNIPKLHALLHYVNCIRSLGSADGYNTESPERLHIDFAKEAYRASNKRDYVEQMAVWLQRREAMSLRESYLVWVEKRLQSCQSMLTTQSEDNMMEDEDEDDGLIDPINVTQCDINITYSLAKRPPHQNLTVEKLKQKFGTINFLPALSAFLRHNLPATTIIPGDHDRFDAYKQIVIFIPSNRYLSEHIRADRVRTVPSVDSSGRALAKPAHFDTAFIVEDLPLYESEGGISGNFLLFLQQILL